MSATNAVRFASGATSALDRASRELLSANLARANAPFSNSELTAKTHSRHDSV